MIPLLFRIVDVLRLQCIYIYIFFCETSTTIFCSTKKSFDFIYIRLDQNKLQCIVQRAHSLITSCARLSVCLVRVCKYKNKKQWIASK